MLLWIDTLLTLCVCVFQSRNRGGPERCEWTRDAIRQGEIHAAYTYTHFYNLTVSHCSTVRKAPSSTHKHRQVPVVVGHSLLMWRGSEVRGGRRWLRYFSPDSKQEVAAGAASPSYCPTTERTTHCSASIRYCIFPISCLCSYVAVSDLFIW